MQTKEDIIIQNSFYSNRLSFQDLHQDFGHLYRITLPNLALV